VIGGERFLELFGAYQWRDAGNLLVVPMDSSKSSHRLVQVDVENGRMKELTDPETNPFKIAAGNWKVSTDGSKVVYVSATDGNIWLMTLSE